MANYTPTFTKPYPGGWVDKPSKTTPATAEIMNSYDTAIATLEAYLRDNAIKTVSANTEVKSGTKIATITIDGTEYVIYSPSVSYESSITGGTKVGTITVGTNTFDVYAPTSSAGGSTVSVVPKTLTGTNIAEITVDGTAYQLYAPTGGSGSTVTAEATLTEGTQIGKITIDGVETILYAPTASTITVDDELSATSENPVQNKVVDAAVKNLQQQIDAGGTGGGVTVDSELSTESENPVQNKVVTEELNKKLEVLGDGTRSPDAVNFDLDSELSLTSTKAVQNKVISEEFQKYNNKIGDTDISDIGDGTITGALNAYDSILQQSEIMQVTGEIENTVKFYKSGNTVTVYIDTISYSFVQWTIYILGVLPEGYRPRLQVHTGDTRVGGYAKGKGRLIVNTNGQIILSFSEANITTLEALTITFAV